MTIRKVIDASFDKSARRKNVAAKKRNPVDLISLALNHESIERRRNKKASNSSALLILATTSVCSGCATKRSMAANEITMGWSLKIFKSTLKSSNPVRA